MPRHPSNKKIKVLHVVGGMNAGGLETLIMNLYRNIDHNKVHFDFAVQSIEKHFYNDEIINLGGRIIPHPKPKEGIKKFMDSFEETIKKYGPYDVIHSHVLFFSGIVLSVGRKQGVPIRIAHSHSTNDSRKESLIRKLYRGTMRRKILKNATHLIGCSKEACEYAFGKKSYESGIAKHFPNAIDLTKYKGLKKDKQFLIEELNLPNDSTIIGHVGRFTKSKNHRFIIELFYRYLDEDPNSHLVLVGEGDEKNDIEDLVKKYKIKENVHFLGLRNDVPQILSSIDLFLFPSLYEGLGVVLIEAQAAGTPCVISDVIPKEADLNIGLIYRLSLSDNIEKWIKTLKKVKNIELRNWDAIETALVEIGYDIRVSSQKLLEIYSNDVR